MHNAAVVTTTYGPVRGWTDAQGVTAFKGIRYGADTSASRRAWPRTAALRSSPPSR